MLTGGLLIVSLWAIEDNWETKEVRQRIRSTDVTDVKKKEKGRRKRGRMGEFPHYQLFLITNSQI
ncbi:hypothetical protein [Microcoleus sp. S13C4]|uniref:hypothetical protein n=1 Tax=Microcoleus sp. S13C4 TaxID=3055410 RepID=UPI002FD13223